jgi:two-component system, OmpR family, phosphate regulon sensor histidine kinase PhoR
MSNMNKTIQRKIMFRKISWELTFSYILVIVFSMAVLGIFLLNFVESYFTENARQDLYRQSQLIAESWPKSIRMGERPSREIRYFWSMVDRISNQTGYRVRVLSDRGISIYDTGGDEEPDISIRDEVVSALSGTPARGGTNMGLTQAYPVYDYGIPGTERQVIGVIYICRANTYLESILSYVRRQFYLGFSISLLISLMLALLFSHYITKPIVEITNQTDRMSAGNLKQRVEVKTRNELGTLSEKFNIMAEKLQGTMDQLLGEKNKLAAVINTMAGGVLVIDEDRKVVMINKTAIQMLGLRDSNILGKNINTIIPGSPLLLLIEDSEMKKETRSTLESLADGSSADAWISPLFSEEEKPSGAVIILNDITEFRRLDRMRAEFVSNVSHELRTPLASIKGLSELLIDGALEEEKAVDFLESINREIDRLTRLVKDLLDLSRMESGMMKFEVHPISVEEAITQVVTRLTPQAGKKNISIITELECSQPVKANMDRVQQVLINLVDNAIRHNRSNEKIIIRTARKDNYNQVEVEDTGPGINPEHLERIFERFYRADRARSRGQGGSGLGLAISQQIVENMGGTIGVNSTPKKGTTFYFTLPLWNE